MLKSEKIQFTAGESILKGDNKSEACEANTWSSCCSESFNLRVGPDYSKNGNKAPSSKSLCEVVGVDLIQCNKRIDNIGSKLNFPSKWLDLNTSVKNMPPLFIVNFQIPSQFPISLFKEITDGPGASLVIYFRMSQVGYYIYMSMFICSVCSYTVYRHCIWLIYSIVSMRIFIPIVQLLMVHVVTNITLCILRF